MSNPNRPAPCVVLRLPCALSPAEEIAQLWRQARAMHTRMRELACTMGAEELDRLVIDEWHGPMLGGARVH